MSNVDPAADQGHATKPAGSTKRGSAFLHPTRSFLLGNASGGAIVLAALAVYLQFGGQTGKVFVIGEEVRVPPAVVAPAAGAGNRESDQGSTPEVKDEQASAGKAIAKTKKGSSERSKGGPQRFDLGEDNLDVQVNVILRGEEVTPRPTFSPSARSIFEDPQFINSTLSAMPANYAQRTHVLNPDEIYQAIPPEQRNSFLECVAIANAKDGYYATGTLIAPNLVLTAAHVAKKNPTKVYIGENVTVPGMEVPVREDGTIVHAAFAEQDPGDPPSKPKLINDLALLVLAAEVKPEVAKPVEMVRSELIAGAKIALVVGFGVTDDETLKKEARQKGSNPAAPRWGFGKKRWGRVPIASCDCSGAFDGILRAQAFGCTQGMEIVAADLDRALLARVDTCDGDSGGPLYVLDGDRWLLAGVTSRPALPNVRDMLAMQVAASQGHRAPLKFICGSGGIYTRLDKYSSFLDEGRKKAAAAAAKRPTP